jgi:hypothetical protein
MLRGERVVRFQKGDDIRLALNEREQRFGHDAFQPGGDRRRIDAAAGAVHQLRHDFAEEGRQLTRRGHLELPRQGRQGRDRTVIARLRGRWRGLLREGAHKAL